MDKNAIKKFAVWARRELISRVSQRAAWYGITEKDPIDEKATVIHDVVLTKAEQDQRRALIARIRREGYQQVMEEVAYTWFNRFIALRFMEVNGYLPSYVRVFSDESGAFNPQILAEAIHLDLNGLDMEKVYALEEANEKEALFKYLVIAQCNDLNRMLPGMFQRIEDYTELLFPDYLLREGSVIEQMVTTIPEEDWKDAVQIIGWLYQYYNAEPKDEVFAALKKNIKISKEKIPAATQLFTPDWIVRYMVENSLGRLWVEGHPNDELKANWKYYLEEASQEPEVEKQLKKIRAEYAQIDPASILCCDPCMGSGHILVYMFDVLMQIYLAYGYTTNEAVESIVRNNLWGMDIDDRAAQLAYFAVMMKAQQYDKRWLAKQVRHPVQPNVFALQDSGNWPTFERQMRQAFTQHPSLFADPAIKTAKALFDAFADAKEFGSIIQPEVTLEELTMLENTLDEMAQKADLMDFVAQVDANMLLETLKPLILQARGLVQKYHAVVTNPPYMGASNMNSKLSDFIKENYADYKSDFFSAFMIRASKMTRQDGYCGFFMPYVWMFIQSYEKLRQYLYTQCTIETLIQFEYSAFEEATVPVCTLAFRNNHISGKKGCYFRLTDFRGGMEVQRQKTLEAIADHNCGFYYEQTSDNYSIIPGAPVAYWVSDAVYRDFKMNLLSSVATTKQGFKTGDNDRFLRLWFETSLVNTSFDKDLSKKWFPCTKGGDFRRWYGNYEYVVNWENDGMELKSFVDEKGKLRSRPQNLQINFTEELTWSSISSSWISFRYAADYFMYESKGPVLTPRIDYYTMLGYLNSNVYQRFIQIVAPTLDYSEGAVLRVPYLRCPDSTVPVIARECVDISRADWDSFETSWHFKVHPIVRWSRCLRDATSIGATMHYYYGYHPEVHSTVELCYMLWQGEANERFNKLKTNEEELNRIFIGIYGLQDELTPEVEDKDVTVYRIMDEPDEEERKMRYVLSRKDAIITLISYAVGCMFGRYSLDEEGLILAGQPYSDKFVYACVQPAGTGRAGEESLSSEQGDCYIRLQDGAVKKCGYAPDQDNILPITDDEYFNDDIVGKFVSWVRAAYGGETLEENLRFVADALGGKGTPREAIRNYFLNDFYKDHLKTYQKRPIYWLFDSGKKNGFKCLIYMHRYRPDTIARIRTDYVHETQARYRTAIETLERQSANASTGERVKLQKRLTALKVQAEELRVYEEKIHHLADQMIPIDLDDGVKVNYAKFADVLAPIK